MPKSRKPARGATRKPVHKRSQAIQELAAIYGGLAGFCASCQAMIDSGCATTTIIGFNAHDWETMAAFATFTAGLLLLWRQLGDSLNSARAR